MTMTHAYAATEPSRADIDNLQGPAVLEFGAPWCGFCKAAQPLIAEALGQRQITHIKVEDGKGRPLGRSFRVKLWPTLIFLDNGKESARVVRPEDAEEIRQALSQLAQG